MWRQSCSKFQDSITLISKNVASDLSILCSVGISNMASVTLMRQVGLFTVGFIIRDSFTQLFFFHS